MRPFRHEGVKIMSRILVSVILALGVSGMAQAQTKKAAPAKAAATKDSSANTWDLTGIFADEAAWKAGMEKVKAGLPELAACKGKLGDSAKTLKKCLDIYLSLSEQTYRINSWTSLQKATDTGLALNTERDTLSNDLLAKLSETASFIEPEITKLGKDKVMKLAKDDDLKPYSHLLRTTIERADHIMDAGKEGLLASLGPVLGGGRDLQQLLMTSDIPWKSINIGGKQVTIDQMAYTKYRQSPDRNLRSRVFDAFYSTLTKFQRTFGENLGRSVKRNVIVARARNYPNAVSMVLDGEKIPQEVYRTLIAEVNNGLPALHEYLNFQKKRMGVKTLEYSDAYAPGINWKGKFTIEDSKKITAAALAPLGEDYVNRFNKAISERWQDVYPKKGKQGGAFMDPSVYALHPFVFLNHQDDFNSLSTFAHEWGHAMHSVYTNASQPYMYANYATFIAEIASTANEVLLNHYMVKNAKTNKEKAFYLEALLESIRATFFRQTQFGEFELALHEEIEKGGALSGEGISKIYGGIARKYYGHDKDVMKVNEKYFSEWAFVPHFYGSFYVYQYATSFSAAVYFATQIIEGKEGALEKYLTVLKAGGSKYPYDILLDAGVDMKSPQVYQAVVELMKKTTEQLKALK